MRVSRLRSLLISFLLLTVCFSLTACGGVGVPNTASHGETASHAESWTDMSWSDLSSLSSRLANASSLDEKNSIAREAGIYDESERLTNTTRRVDLTNGYSVDVRIIGVCHDIRSDGSVVGLTFMTTGALGRSSMNAADTVRGGWEASSLRSALSSEYLDLFPDEVRQLIVPVEKATNNRGLNDDTSSVTNTEDNLWLPSVHEVCGDVAWEQQEYGDSRFDIDDTLNAEGTQYQYFSELGVDSTNANSGLTLDGTSGKSSWWLRTPFPELERNNGTGSYFYCVSDIGNPASYLPPSQDSAVLVCFCL